MHRIAAPAWIRIVRTAVSALTAIWVVLCASVYSWAQPQESSIAMAEKAAKICAQIATLSQSGSGTITLEGIEYKFEGDQFEAYIGAALIAKGQYKAADQNECFRIWTDFFLKMEERNPKQPRQSEMWIRGFRSAGSTHHVTAAAFANKSAVVFICGGETPFLARLSRFGDASMLSNVGGCNNSRLRMGEQGYALLPYFSEEGDYLTVLKLGPRSLETVYTSTTSRRKRSTGDPVSFLPPDDLNTFSPSAAVVWNGADGQDGPLSVEFPDLDRRYEVPRGWFASEGSDYDIGSIRLGYSKDSMGRSLLRVAGSVYSDAHIHCFLATLAHDTNESRLSVSRTKMLVVLPGFDDMLKKCTFYDIDYKGDHVYLLANETIDYGDISQKYSNMVVVKYNNREDRVVWRKEIKSGDAVAIGIDNKSFFFDIDVSDDEKRIWLAGVDNVEQSFFRREGSEYFIRDSEQADSRLVKMDHDGHIVLDKTFGVNDADMLREVHDMGDGEALILGYINNNKEISTFVSRLRPEQNIAVDLSSAVWTELLPREVTSVR